MKKIRVKINACIEDSMLYENIGVIPDSENYNLIDGTYTVICPWTASTQMAADMSPAVIEWDEYDEEET